MSFVVAMSIFALIFASATLLISLSISSKHDPNSVDLEATATDAIRSAVTTRGLPIEWDADTDPTTIQRLGLLKQGTRRTIDLDKIRALGSWVGDETAYESVREALGLGAVEFHLRTYPVFSGANNSPVSDLAGYRVAYVGHFASGTESAASVAESDALTTLGVNYSAAEHTVVGPLAYADKYQDDYDVLAGYLPVRLAGAQGIESGSEASRTYWRPMRTAGSEFSAEPRVFTPSYFDGTYYTFGSTSETDRLILTRADLTGYEITDSTLLDLRHYVNGKNGASSRGYVEVRCFVTCAGNPADTWVKVGADFVSAGSASAFTGATVDLSAFNGHEIAISLTWISDLPVNNAHSGWFVSKAFINATKSGTTTTVYANTLDYTTTKYDTLIVGSDADQANFTQDSTAPLDASTTFQDAIQDWVVAGGNLIAFGSTALDQGWLSPTLTNGAASAYDGALVEGLSDLTHPILNTPNALTHRYYAGSGSTYAPGAGYRDIIVSRKDEFTPVPILTYSGASFEGGVVLTAWQPAYMTSLERERFISNTLMYLRFNDLFVDFGRAFAADAPIGSATQTVLLDASALGVGTMQVGVTLYVWE